MADEARPLCPFYGRFADIENKQLRSSGGNQCALQVDAFHACYLSEDGERPDLSNCRYGGSQRAQYAATFEFIEEEDQPPTVTGSKGDL